MELNFDARRPAAPRRRREVFLLPVQADQPKALLRDASTADTRRIRALKFVRKNSERARYAPWLPRSVIRPM